MKALPTLLFALITSLSVHAADTKPSPGFILNDPKTAIEQAKREGGKVLCGGHRLSLQGTLAGGHFVEPTIVRMPDQTADTVARVLVEQVFQIAVSTSHFGAFSLPVLQTSRSS